MPKNKEKVLFFIRVVIASSKNIFRNAKETQKNPTVFLAGDAATEEVNHGTCLMLVKLSELLPSATSSSMAPLT